MAEGTTSVVGKIKGAIAKLPFNNLVGKIPALAKFSGYANYVACALAVIILGILFAPSNSVKPAVNELKKINNESARFWIRMIEENGIDAISDKETLLTIAVKNDNYDLAEACIKSGANVNLHQDATQYFVGSSPITIAVQNGYSDIAELLIKNKALLVEPDNQYIDAVYETLRNLNEDMMKLILPKVSKSEINFLNEKNKRKEFKYNFNDKDVAKEFVNLINNYGYKTKDNFSELPYAMRAFEDDEFPQLVKAIKTMASESYYKDKYYAAKFITYVEEAWNIRKGRFKDVSAEVEKQKDDLISWLEKQGYERESK